MQIGRFPQLDPLTDEYHFLTPYQYASNDPITNIDLDGLEGVSSTGLKEVVVQSTIKHATTQVAKTTVGSITANFAKGLVESGINTLVGALNVVIHPIETTKQVGSLIDKSSTFEGRLMLGLNLGISALNTYNNFKSGNADVKANIAGNLVGDIAQLFIGTGEVKAASYAMEASNFERQMLKFAQNAEKAELGAAKTSTNAFKSFTASNYRHNLQVLTGKSGIGMDAHHIFPQAQKFQSYFQKAGINIHDPKNLVWWGSGAHRSAAGAYNNAWSNFFRANPNATGQQIQNFGGSLMKQYGFKL